MNMIEDKVYALAVRVDRAEDDDCERFAVTRKTEIDILTALYKVYAKVSERKSDVIEELTAELTHLLNLNQQQSQNNN